MTRSLLALTALLLAAAPATASTVPRVDLKAGQSSVAFGAVDVNLDHAFGDRLALGLTTNLLSVAARATYRLGGEPDGNCWGLVFSAGPSVYPVYSYTPLYGGSVPSQVVASGYAQPAFVWSRPLGSGFFFRGTLGPVFFTRYITEGSNYRYLENMVVPLWANMELSFAAPWGEATLGGGLGGLRFTR